jgi:hypothetical protein
MATILIASALVLALVFFYVVRTFREKHLGIWLGAYLRQHWSRRDLRRSGETVHVLFCQVDHFEPLAGPTKDSERERMRAWTEGYPRLAGAHRDSEGRPPQHTWFYPGEAYDAECLDGLSRLAQGGYGEIELHLHHGFDIPERLEAKLTAAVNSFSRHGALVTAEEPPRFTYGFIHGNLGLNNARGPEYCGVNNELVVLRKTGCYADFSMPNAPCNSQTRKINSIYYASDVPGQRKSHDDGIDVEVGKPPDGDLMIVQGPLALDWSNRKFGLFPRIENAELSSAPSRSRVKLWVSQHIHVKGRPEWMIVKVSCHGAEDDKRDLVLGRAADQMFSYLEEEYRDKPGYALHYVTARELYNIIKAAEAGEKGNPAKYRDYLIPPYQTHSQKAVPRTHDLRDV